MTTNLQYQIALSLFPRIGAVNARRLVAYMGSVENIFEASKNDFKNIPGIGDGLIKTVVKNRNEVLLQAEIEIAFIQKYKLKPIFYLDKSFPRRLAQCVDAPVIMFMKGNVDLEHPKMISIVGTRNATDYGRQLTNDLIKTLAEKGIETVIVSGLAYGIDIAAHKAALKYKLPTIGVLGHGLDKMYPATHATFAKEMVASNGALLTDFPSNCKIDPGNFLRRNRIIAGLSDCTIVVESAAKGGALVTADIANSYNRDVFAFPGRTNDEYSLGCNQLIKRNGAAMIESADDLIALMGWEANKAPTQQVLLIDLSDEEQNLVNTMKVNEISTTDLLARELSITVQQINSLLLNLEFKGVVKSLPGNRFKLIVTI